MTDRTKYLQNGLIVYLAPAPRYLCLGGFSDFCAHLVTICFKFSFLSKEKCFLRTFSALHTPSENIFPSFFGFLES